MRKRVDPNPVEVPPPGSREAAALGCKCPVIDNAHGRGYHHDRYGRPLYIVNEDCPLHFTAEKELVV